MHMSNKIDFKSRTLLSTLRKTHMPSAIASKFTLYSARIKNTHVKQNWQHTYSIWHARNAHIKWDWIQVLLSIRHAHKTYMLSKADFKSRALFGTNRYAYFWWDLLQHSFSIRYAQNCKCQLRLNGSRTLFDKHRNGYVKRDCLKPRTLFGTHRKRTLGEIVYKLALYSLYSVRLKRTCLVRLNSSLVLYLART